MRRVGLCTGQDGTSLQVEEQVQGEDGQWRHSFVLDLGQRARTADGKKNRSVGAIHNLLLKREREIYDLMGRGVVPQDKGDESNEPVGVLTC